VPQPRTNADAAAAMTGVELSSTGFWKLPTGRGDNPQFDTLTAFARLFGVPLGFFGDEEDAEVLGDQAALAALISQGIS
jgi:transcriptional regulator with XRE-family HTH domain